MTTDDQTQHCDCDEVIARLDRILELLEPVKREDIVEELRSPT